MIGRTIATSAPRYDATAATITTHREDRLFE